MRGLKRFILEIHRRSLWQVVGIYLAGSWVVLQVVDTMADSIGLPEWFPPVAFGLLLVGLPIVVATAFVQEGVRFGASDRSGPSVDARADRGSQPGRIRSSSGLGRIFNWRNAIGGGVIAFALWGIFAAAWVVLGGPPAGDETDGRKSIAVLPFVNMSGDPDNEYFSDGITDDIITQLSKIADLTVISRTSTMRYKDTDKSLPEIGRELGVSTILEGGVRRERDQVRINAQLVDARRDQHLWAQTYDRRLTDIFAIQSDVALRIADALRARLSETVRERIESAPTDSPEAYELYMRGRQLWYGRTALDSAIRYFQRALDADPDFALSYAGLADVYVLYPNWGLGRATEAYPLVQRYARRAIATDSLLAEPHASLAMSLYTFEHDWDAAEREFRYALDLNPSYATGTYWYSYFLFRSGRIDEGLERGRRAVELDPRSPAITAGLGGRLYFARHYSQAEVWLQRARELDDTYPAALGWLGLVRIAQGRAEAGVPLVERATMGSGSTFPRAMLAYAYAAAGREAAAALLADASTPSEREGTLPTWIAAAHAALGDREAAFHWLERAYEVRDDWLTNIGFGVWMDPVRDDPRFADLLVRVGLAPGSTD